MSANEVVEQRKVKPCPISRSDFMASAAPVEVVFAGQKLFAQPKDFRPGADGKASFGFHAHGKSAVTFGSGDDVLVVPVQVNVLITCIGSKDAAP